MKHLNELVEYMQSTCFNRMKALEMVEDLQRRTCSNCSSKDDNKSNRLIHCTRTGKREHQDFCCDDYTMQQ